MKKPTIDQMTAELRAKGKAKFLEPSKVKQRLYHGTNKNIKQYDQSKLGGNPDTAHQTSQLGFFLTDNPDEASAYAGKRKGANVQALHAQIKNPYHTSWDEIHEQDGWELQQKLKKRGYDGVVIKDKGNPNNYVAFHPHQIKSAIGNRGTYDVNDPDITKAKGGKVKDPKKTVKAYKLFRVHEKHPGKLFPLFVDANTPVEMGKWVDAKEGEMANGKVKSKIGALAYRPGWHAGDLPIATHIGEKSDPSLTAPDRRPANHVWAEVEMPHDVDWQSVANERGMNAQGKIVPVKAHITDQIPVGGHYRYKTNPNMTGEWLIGGSMKVNKVLTDKEVDKINKAAGLADLPRAQPMRKKTFGFASGGEVGPDEWKAEAHVNHAPKISRKAVGGSQQFPLRVPADNAELAPEPKYPWLDKASQGVQAAHDFISAPFGYGNPAGEMVSKALGVPAVAETLGNIAYGTPVTSGSGMTSNLRPETAEAALTVAPLVGPAVKAVKKAGKAVAPTVAEMAAELAEKGGTPLRQFAVPNEGKLSKEEYSRMMREKYAAENAARAARKEAAPVAQEVKAPADDLGFYSGVEKAALNLQRKVGTGDDFIADLMKNPGVNQARLEEMGLDALKGRPNVTADEVRQLAAKNKPKLSETVRIERDEAAIEELERRHDEILDYKHEAEAAGDRRSVANYEDELQENIAMQKRLKGVGEAKFGPKYHAEYNMPGGEDYREIRIKMPSNRPSLNNMSRAEYDAAVKKADSEGLKNFTNSVHHDNEENVLLHLRVKNHRDADGKNGLLIDELQSDWHQQGRKKGYAKNLSADEKQEIKDILSKKLTDEGASPADMKRLAELQRKGSGVPDAPFKENWYQLGLKRAIKEAADSGMQRVYLTTGKTQNERFALSKQVSEIHYTDRGTLYAYDKDGQLVMHENVPKDKLPEYIGKEASQKLISQPAEGGNRVLAGVDMDVGGEGMKHWYDNQYINYLKKYANEHGAQVGMTKLPVTRIENHWPEFRDWFAKNHSDRGSSSTAHSYFTQGKNNKYVRDFADQLEQKYEPVYYIELNNALRKSAKKGQAYKAGGIVHKAFGGITRGNSMDMPTLAQMRVQLNQRKNPDYVDSIGIEQAVDMNPKKYISPNPRSNAFMPVGGVADQNGLPVGGIDQDNTQQGQQLMPQQDNPLNQQQQQADLSNQTGFEPDGGSPQGPTPPMGNMLSMTPQGQALQAMSPRPNQPPGMAAGGMVNPKNMAMIRAQMKYAKGGSHYPPAPPLKQSEIEAMAERMARQTSGAENANQVSIQQTEREKNLPVGITSRKKIEVPIINYEEHKGSSTVGVPGDPSRGGVVPSKRKLKNPIAGETLHSIGGEKLEYPVPMYGGYNYGAYGNKDAWASDLGASRGLFNVVKRLAEENPDSKVLGHYHKMTPKSLNHAVHMLDTVLSHHKPHKQDPEHIAVLNHLMRNVAITKGKHDIPYPEFPGFENPADVMLHGAINSGMRKKLISLLGTEKHFPGGKQKMHDIMYALSHPELRNVETGAGGSAILQFDPSRELKESISSHPTYGYDIPSKLVGRTRYTTPAKILAPRSMHNAEREIAAMGKKVIPFNQAKLNIIREPIDEQYINQMGAFEQAMKKRLGYKKGGKVDEKIQKDTMNLELMNKRKKAK